MRIRIGERLGNPKKWSVLDKPTYSILWKFAYDEPDFM
jgi:hypothetical protein